MPMSIVRISAATALVLAVNAFGFSGALSAQRTQISVGATPPDSGGSLDVGRPAPDFTLPWAGKGQVGPADRPFRLAQAAGQPVVLAFYPKDFTSGCTAEMTTFAEQYAELFGDDAVVVGISADSLETHRRFADSLGLPFKLLSDPDQEVARLYASDGQNGYNRRTVYVIDRKGKIAYRNMAFGAIDPQAYAALKAAVANARK